MADTILERWNLTAEELTQIVDSNPSLRGFMLGYVGEFQLRKIWFSDERISGSRTSAYRMCANPTTMIVARRMIWRSSIAVMKLRLRSNHSRRCLSGSWKTARILETSSVMQAIVERSHFQTADESKRHAYWSASSTLLRSTCMRFAGNGISPLPSTAICHIRLTAVTLQRNANTCWQPACK